MDPSAKLMLMITVHEKSIFRGEPEEKNPAEGGDGGRRERGRNQSTGLLSVWSVLQRYDEANKDQLKVNYPAD